MPYYSNISKSMTLTVAVDIDDTVFNVNDASGLPTNYPYYVVIDPFISSVEVVTVTNRIGNALTVTRGQQDTAAQNHSLGATLWHGATAVDFQNASDHILDSTGVHGIDGASSVVGTDMPQTLTLKTMSGLNNFFTDLPASEITGSFEHVVINQPTASVATLTLNRNGAATADVLSTQYVTISSSGRLNVATEPVSGQSQRWYNAGFAGAVANMSDTGRLTCVGLTTTGSITATGQTLGVGAITCTSITASGLISANAGVTVPTGQSLTVNSGGTFASNGTATFASGQTATFSGTANLNATVSFGASSTVTFNNGFTVPTGETALLSGTAVLAVNGTINSNGTLNLDGPINRDTNAAKVLVSSGSVAIGANVVSSGGVGVTVAFGSTTTNLTVPTGRTASLVVQTHATATGGTAGGVFNSLIPRIDAVEITNSRASVGISTNVPRVDVGRTSVMSLTAGTYALDLAYVNDSGTATITYQSGLTGYSYQLYY